MKTILDQLRAFESIGIGAVKPGAGTCIECGHPTITRALLPDGSEVPRCTACHNIVVARHRKARRAQLVAEPRCQFCRQRATVFVGAGPRSVRAKLCRKHTKLVDRMVMLAGRIGTFETISGPGVVAILVGHGLAMLRPAEDPCYDAIRPNGKAVSP